MSAELVDVDTGEIVGEQCSPEEARDLTDQIKVAVESTWHLIKRAYETRAWAALGYHSWDDYCTREFGAHRIKLPREERQEIVASLRESGLSTRAIASATGNSKNTITEDLREVSQVGTPEREPDDEPGPDPAPVKGTDGKTYKAKPRRRTAPPPEAQDIDLEAERREAERQTRADRLYRALEYLGNFPVPPDEAIADVPENQSFRIDEHLEAARWWLERFAHEWEQKQRRAGES